MFSTLKSAGGVSLLALAASLYLAQREPKAPETASLAAPAASLPRLAPTPAPAPMRRSAGFAVTLNAVRNGHFIAPVEVNGRRVDMLVDTGASIVALSARDARTLGVMTSPSDRTITMSTANGLVQATRTRLAEVRVDTVTARDVEAVVMPEGALAGSLLGMSFLSKLSGFQIADGELTLKP